MAAGAAASFLIPSPDQRIAFLNVGQGDSILLQDNTVQVLVDGGPDGTVLQRLAEEMPWQDQRIEIMIVTHPDKDHLAGLLHVLDRFEVGLVMLPNAPDDSTLQKAWLDQLIARKIPVRFASAGQTLRTEALTLEVLHPEAGNTSGDNNNRSVVVRVEFHDLSILMTGDVNAAIENHLIKKYGTDKLDVEVLKAGHHGSKTSTSTEFLKAVTPDATIISVGKNSYGHPSPDVLKRLEGVGGLWRTDEEGTIRWRWAKGQWWLGCGSERFTIKSESC